MFIDFRKNIQHININGESVYIWLYRKTNVLAFGINGTSFHEVIADYKNKTKCEILNIIMGKTWEYLKVE